MTIPAVDPVVQLVLRGALSLLLVSAALHKLQNRARFQTAVAQYDLLPPSWVAPVALLLLSAEAATAGALWLPDLARAAALTAAGLLTLYAGAIAVNLQRGRRDIDCGCVGAGGTQLLSGALVVRNGILVTAALMCALPTTARRMIWIDAVTACAGLLAIALLYAGSTGLLAAHSRMASAKQRFAPAPDEPVAAGVVRA